MYTRFPPASLVLPSQSPSVDPPPLNVIETPSSGLSFARAHTERLGNLCDYASPGLTSFLNSTANCSTSPLEYLISILTSTKTKFLIFALTWSSPSHLSPNWTNPLLSVLDCQSQPMPCSSANPLDYPWNVYLGLNSLPINFDLFQAIRI